VEAVYRDTFAAYGVTAAAEEVHRAVLKTWRDVAERRAIGEERWSIGGGEAAFWRQFVAEVFGRVGGGELPDALLAGLVRHFRQACHWRVYPEVFGVLAALKRASVKVLVVSNWDSSLPPLLEELGLTSFFDDVVVSTLVGVSKPARGIFDVAVRRAGVSHVEALHVGDSLHDDYHGAKAAGLCALLLDRAGRAAVAEGVESIASLEEVVRRILPAGAAAAPASR
jgi:putative hydrolase of the HAD superfamily